MSNQPDIRRIVAKKVTEMNRLTPGRAAFLEALDRKPQDKRSVKKPVNVSAYQRAMQSKEA